MSVFDPTVDEEYDGKKDCDENKGCENFWFPEQQEDEQDDCCTDHQIRVIPNDCKGTCNASDNKRMFDERLTLFAAESGMKLMSNLQHCFVCFCCFHCFNHNTNLQICNGDILDKRITR